MTAKHADDDDIDFAAEFAELDKKIAERKDEPAKEPADTKPRQVRVQFRGVSFDGGPAIEVTIGDNVAWIDGNNLDLLASSINRLGVNNNTLFMWGYLPPEDSD